MDSATTTTRRNDDRSRLPPILASARLRPRYRTQQFAPRIDPTMVQNFRQQSSPNAYPMLTTTSTNNFPQVIEDEEEKGMFLEFWE
jgi:hypothetical protein